MKVTIFLAAVFASVAYTAERDGDVFKIIDDLENLNRGAQDLNTILEAWDGNPSNSEAAINMAGKITDATNYYNEQVKDYSGLVETDTLRLQPPVYELTNSVSKAVDTIIDLKPKILSFTNGNITITVVAGQINGLFAGATALSDTIVSKVPDDLQGVAKILAAGISDNLKRANETYACEKCVATTSDGPSSFSARSTYLVALSAILAVAVVL